MKKFIVLDFNIQSYLILAFIAILVIDIAVLHSAASVMVYFLIALEHIISSAKRFFNKQYVRRPAFKIYYGISMVFMLLFLILIIACSLKLQDSITGFMFGMFAFGIFGTPVLAIAYYLICYRDYRKVKETEMLKRNHN
ncbi:MULTISPECIES: hypothetical protein [Chryseobacterium]|uniref:Amino acid transporter n=1 Tax=Chryseobacterium camelliae TaxID=1265445 RepID=A0ABU0TIA7_9FLAO|nr:MULTISPECIES: hypothetical protein [Chryseobacterium]MDT3409354.1 amino acid transporter [Pseudacidovorax intermedius]MDQ1096782.1 amino acid transporter [Chryseobacterium camelliae]MDQ1100724.1 amino acid transporter [Chryseobacterium sp. SORGH_AS_1048]MDR6088063.1 amino acid transporter [Chryseobacterium sp. SORGH_AS_0909]MDR6132438.1 amino acid transporter [Chryseobacterium sp. SORGH_AS_1175]